MSDGGVAAVEQCQYLVLGGRIWGGLSATPRTLHCFHKGGSRRNELLRLKMNYGGGA